MSLQRRSLSRLLPFLSWIWEAMLNIKWGLAIACVGFVAVGGAAAESDHPSLERTIRQLIPQPARCSHSPEPLFSCRYEAPPEQSLVFELASGKDGPSASLTHNYDNRKARDFLALMREYFLVNGIDAKAFDACIRQSHYSSEEMSFENFQLVCRHVEFSERVTYDVFAMPVRAAHQEERKPQAMSVIPQNADIQRSHRTSAKNP